jgi:signal transduction histidine kinase
MSDAASEPVSVVRLLPVDDLWPPIAGVARFALRRPTLSDVICVLTLGVLTAIPLLLGPENRWWVWLLDVALVLPLVVRRHHPVALFWVLAAVAFVQWLADVPLAADVSLLVALYTVAARREPRDALVAAGVLEFGVVLASIRFAPASDGLTGSLVFLSGLVTAALFTGIALRSHTAYLASIVDRTQQLEHERDQQARLAATAERTRIAREMHDIVAHSLSVVIALADGAALSNRGGADEATEAMQQVSTVGREALAEMRRLLGVLRDDATDPAELAPQPGLGRLEDLLDQVRAVGLPVRVAIRGEPRPISPIEDATAYRIVQESLTNTLKHADRPTEVSVTIVWASDALSLEVTDDGRVRRGFGRPAGHGLLGMSERAALFDGKVSAGPIAGKGWQVNAQLPLVEVS